MRSIIRNLSDRRIGHCHGGRERPAEGPFGNGAGPTVPARLAELGIMSYEQIGAELGVTKGLIGMLIGISQIPDALVDAIGVL